MKSGGGDGIFDDIFIKLYPDFDTSGFWVKLFMFTRAFQIKTKPNKGRHIIKWKKKEGQMERR